MKKVLLIGLVFILIACAGTPAATQAPIESNEPVDVATSAPEATPEIPLGKSAPVALPSGPVTLVVLGDSLTQGDGDDAGLGGYPGRLLTLINETRPGSTLINYGQSGWNSDALINGDQGLESQLDRAVAELNAAAEQGRGGVALVWIGSNDLWYLYEYGGEINDEGDAQDLAHFSANLDVILSRLRETGALVVIAKLDDQSRRPVAIKGEAFTAITQDELARMSAQVIRYNDTISAKAAQHGALTVDFYATDIFTSSATLYDDGNHPNSAGYETITQIWWIVLRAALGG